MTRLLNVTVAAIGLVFALPMMLVIAIVVKLSSPGPVIYKQTRIGIDRRSKSRPQSVDRRGKDLGGKPFGIYKFRTMRSGTDTTQRWADKNDNRVTPVGKILRQYRLDELPQFVNVLLGHMNVVGPRPEQPVIFADLSRKIGFYYSRRQHVLPGITGLAQINLAYDTDLDDVRQKLAHDLIYIQKRSPGLDIRIMAQTLPVMMSKRGSR